MAVQRHECFFTNFGQWEYSPKRYWPEDKTVDFYAYSPASSRSVTQGLADYSPSQQSMIDYQLDPISETYAQEDFLVARNPGQNYESSNGNGTVTLQFHHALSRLRFYAKKNMPNNSDIIYVINGVELTGLNKSAQLDMTKVPSDQELTYMDDQLGGVPFQPWENHSGDVVYAADMGTAPVYLSDKYESILGNTGAMMVIPQPTDFYAPDPDDWQAPAINEFSIKVSYTAFTTDGHIIAGTKNVDGDIDPAVKYFAVKDPLYETGDGIIFEMGRQYNFYLEFSNEVKDVKFEVKVSNWKDTLENPDTPTP